MNRLQVAEQYAKELLRIGDVTSQEQGSNHTERGPQVNRNPSSAQRGGS